LGPIARFIIFSNVRKEETMEDSFRLLIQGVSGGEKCAAVENKRLKRSEECFNNHMRLEESI